MSRLDVLSEPWVHVHGAGVPAVFVHGIHPGSPDDFAAQQPLGDTFHLLAVDRRGYGSNPDPGGPLGWPVDCDDVMRLVEAVGGRILSGIPTVAWSLPWPPPRSPPSTAPSDEHHARVGRALVEGLIRRIGAELVVFEHSTHFAASEEPERFNDLLHAVWTRAMDRA